MVYINGTLYFYGICTNINVNSFDLCDLCNDGSTNNVLLLQ